MQDIVKETVCVVPEAQAVLASMRHGVGDVEEVFPELARDIFIGGVFTRQFEGNGQQIEGVHCHPAGAVGLLDEAARGQGRATVKHADVVQTQEASLEDVHAFRILPVYPPSEIQEKFMEDAFQELTVTLSFAFFLDLVHTPGCPRVDRRIHVSQCPFVCRQLAIGMHVPLPQHQYQLLFGEIRIHQGQGDAVKGQVPGRVPRILPLVGHRKDVGVVQMTPLVVSSSQTLSRRLWLC